MSAQPNRWHYVPTDLNPGNLATRSVSVAHLQRSNWFSDKAFLYHDKIGKTAETNSFSLVEPEADEEICPEVTTFSTKTQGLS